MLQNGNVLGGRYQVQKILGRGGMSAVYLAQHMQLDRPVAIKQMTLAAQSEQHLEMLREQFRCEAKVLTTLHHPGLPRVYDFFYDANQAYFVMDYVAGQTLNQIQKARGRVSELEVLEWARQLCDVLDYLHSQIPPVIFRDLKPANVMLDEENRIRLIDFGIAKCGLSDNGQTDTAIRGAGTAGFAPPEQYAGGTDPRSDVYALGATFYTLLCGDPPPISVLLASGDARLPPIHTICDVSSSTANAIEAMLRPRSIERPQSIAEVRELLGFTAAPAFAQGVTTIVRPTPQRFPRLVPAIGAGIAAVILGGLWFARPHQPLPLPPPAAMPGLPMPPPPGIMVVFDPSDAPNWQATAGRCPPQWTGQAFAHPSGDVRHFTFDVIPSPESAHVMVLVGNVGFFIDNSRHVAMPIVAHPGRMPDGSPFTPLHSPVELPPTPARISMDLSDASHLEFSIANVSGTGEAERGVHGAGVVHFMADQARAAMDIVRNFTAH